MKAVEASGVVKRYGGRSWFGSRPGRPVRPALNRVSLSVDAGETIGLLGPNGAGKTTLLKILSTLIEIDEGEVRVLGHDVSRQPGLVRQRLGLVTCDERSFYWRLSGRQNLKFFADLYRVKDAVAKERIAALLETLGLTEAADRPYHTYSTGMRQKMAIARGLLSDPSLVLFDEPTRSLDPLSARNIRDWIRADRKANPATTRVIATNQLQEAEILCDRVIIVNRGEIVADASIAEIRRRFQNAQHITHRLECRNFSLRGRFEPAPAGLVSVVEEPSDSDDTTWLVLRTARGSDALSVVLAEILRSGGSVEQCQTQEVPFDDIFVSLVLQQAEPEKVSA